MTPSEPASMKTVQIKIHYPVPEGGSLTLRSSLDWDKDIEAETDSEEPTWRLRLSEQPYVEFKACLHLNDQLHWSQGPNHLATLGARSIEISPYFFYAGGTLSREPLVLHDELGYEYRAILYHPSGYHENFQASYPILYFQDDQHTLFPKDLFFQTNSSLTPNGEMLDRQNIRRDPHIPASRRGSGGCSLDRPEGESHTVSSPHRGVFCPPRPREEER